jgi:hypothetical protein
MSIVDKLYTIRRMIDEYIEDHEELQCGYDAWYGEDSTPEQEAACDPSDQYIIGERLDELMKEIKEKVKNL